MKLESFLFCGQAFRDERKRYNLIGIFDAIQSTKAPAAYGPIHVYLRIAGVPSKRDVPFKFEMFEMNNVNTKVAMVEGTFQSETTVAQLNVPMNVVGFPNFGVYRATIVIDGQRLGETEITVSYIEKPAEQKL